MGTRQNEHWKLLCNWKFAIYTHATEREFEPRLSAGTAKRVHPESHSNGTQFGPFRKLKENGKHKLLVLFSENETKGQTARTMLSQMHFVTIAER